MKSILKIGMAIAVLASARFAWATAGDAFLFSTTNTNPNSGNVLSLTSAGQVGTLYIWATAASGDEIIPLSTILTGGGNPTGSAALALSGALTGTNATVTSAQIYNFDSAVPASSIYSVNSPTGTATGVSRWTGYSNFTTGNANLTTTSFTNLNAATAMQSPAGSTYLADTLTGLQRNAGDPAYFGGATVPNGSAAGAWLVGEVKVTAAASVGTTTTLQLSAGPQDITKSGAPSGPPGTTTVLTSNYSPNMGSATINLSLGRTGDINGDGHIDAADIDLMSAKLLALGLPYSTLYDYRGAALGSPPDGLITQADKDRLVGSLIDINGVPTSVGTHSGDADLNGTVNANDYVLLSGHLGQAGGWAAGDFTGDGVVNANDYVLLSGNLGATGGTGQIAAVPEPATFFLCGIGLMGLVGLRGQVTRRR